MKIEIQEGCYGREIFVDGVRWYDIALTDHKNIVERVLNRIKYEKDDKELVIDLLYTIEPDESTYDDDPCEQCGSYFSNDTYEV